MSNDVDESNVRLGKTMDINIFAKQKLTWKSEGNQLRRLLL